MILTQHPDHDYRDMTPEVLIPFAENVNTQTTSNVGTFGVASTTLCAALMVALGILTTKNAEYIANPLKHAAMEAARKAVVKILNKLNQLVDGIADGAGATIDLSGFHKTAGESTKGQKPTICVIHDHYPEVGKGNYYIQVNAKGKCTYKFIVCALDAVVTFFGNQVSVSKGELNVISDTHPHADFSSLPSGDQKLIIVALNAAGMGTPTAPTTISVP